MLSKDFSLDGLDGEARNIAEIVCNVVSSVMPNASGGGCRAFRTVEDHAARKEEFGLESCLILLHDGGDLASFCNYDYMEYARIERLDEALHAKGYFMENCTTWYSAVYKR